MYALRNRLRRFECLWNPAALGKRVVKLPRRCFLAPRPVQDQSESRFDVPGRDQGDLRRAVP